MKKQGFQAVEIVVDVDSDGAELARDIATAVELLGAGPVWVATTMSGFAVLSKVAPDEVIALRVARVRDGVVIGQEKLPTSTLDVTGEFESARAWLVGDQLDETYFDAKTCEEALALI